jgi:hypothetical protein
MVGLIHSLVHLDLRVQLKNKSSGVKMYNSVMRRSEQVVQKIVVRYATVNRLPSFVGLPSVVSSIP